MSASVGDEPAGANCPTGGKRVAVEGGAGTSTISYVCNGAAPTFDVVAAATTTTGSAKVSVADEPAGANCPAGGVAITSQVGTAPAVTSYVCNGATGQSVVMTAEAAGANCQMGGVRLQVGTGAPQFVCNGADGQSVATTPEPTGSNCPAGGVRLQVGTGSPQYVCNGVEGQSVVMSTEPAGANCKAGGVRLQVGSGTPQYVCSGAPGSGIKWETVSAWTYASRNRGYFTAGASRVTVALPTIEREIGDEFDVAATGAGGFTVDAGPAQRIVYGPAVLSPAGAVWTSRSTWSDVRMSSNGTILAKADGQLYASTDAGASWTRRGALGTMKLIASSADAIRLVAVENNQLYTSVDGGASWTARDAARKWAAVASSADGTKLVAGVTDGSIYTSTDSGVTWTPRDTVRAWGSVASSADGTKLVALAYTNENYNDARIYTSSDSGASWTQRPVATPPNDVFSRVVSSADGTRLVAATNMSAQVYTSADSGASWTGHASIVNEPLNDVALSADGSRILAAVTGTGVYSSIDAGATWSLILPVGGYGVAISADGNTLMSMSSSSSTLFTSTAGPSVSGGGTRVTGNLGARVQLTYVGNDTFLVTEGFGTLYGE